MNKKHDNIYFKRCLGCYEPLDAGMYHPRCSKNLFGTPSPPLLDTALNEVDALAQIFLSHRFAITGVQRKLSLQLEQQEVFRLTIVGTLGGAYIMKVQSPEYPQLPENEDLVMHLAKTCGLRVAQHGLLPMRDGNLAYVTKRFDRKGRKKIAVEDLCQLSELLTEQKYRSSHEKVGQVIRKFSCTPGDDVLRYYELVIFSFLIGNNDMHLKNFSLITEDQLNINLSPAFDLLSVRLAISEKDDPEELALTINGKKSKLSLKDFVALASNLQIPEKVALRVMHFQCAAREQMDTLIKKSFLNKEAQLQLTALVKKRMVRLMT